MGVPRKYFLMYQQTTAKALNQTYTQLEGCLLHLSPFSLEKRRKASLK